MRGTGLAILDAILAGPARTMTMKGEKDNEMTITQLIKDAAKILDKVAGNPQHPLTAARRRKQT